MARHIFSLDNGNGTMSAFHGDIDVEIPQFQPLMAEGGEPSGFARLKDGSLALGKMIYAVNPNKVESYHINFKAIPTEENRGVMVEYVRAWREQLIKKNPSAFVDGEECWMIGIPTGWRRKAVVEAYRQIFVDAGYPNPIIVPESNAAMYNAQKSYGAIKRANNKIGVLCLDLGAYSNDATHILPGKVSSYGGFTGASLIERMMLCVNLEGKYALNKKEHNSPELIEVVRKKYNTDPKFRCYMVLQMRQLKENYYTALKDGKPYAKKDMFLAVELDEDDKDFIPLIEEGEQFFELYVNDVLAYAVTEDCSVHSILGAEFDTLPPETQAEIGGKSWCDCLRGFISNTLEKCPELAKAGKTGGADEKPIVLLTGGATNMNFVEDIVLDILPNAELYPDGAPMDTIAKGLWLFGPDKLRALEFDKAFEEILKEKDEADNSVLNVILSKAHDKLGQDIIVQLAVQPFNCIVDAANAWSDYECTSDKIIPNARKAFQKQFENEIPKLVGPKSAECKQYIADEINKLFRGLLKNAEMERTDLFKADELDITYIDEFIKDILLGKGIYELLDEWIQLPDEFYSKLPNPGRINIFSRRKDTLSEYAASMDELNEECRNKIFEMLKELYDSSEIYGPFARECVYELMMALERQKKTLLGELIVEDIADEE